MTGTREEFIEISQELHRLTHPPQRLYRIQRLHREGNGIGRFDHLVCTRQFIAYRATLVQGVHGTYYLHNIHAPSALAPADTYYYLFGYCFSQKDWFRALNYTVEEQLMHVLKWGKQP